MPRVAKVHALAPVLNTQSYKYAFNNQTDTMLKVHDGHAYIFAGLGFYHKTGSKNFTLPAGILGTEVEVVGENRTLQIENGTFEDSFADEFTHHVYKIASQRVAESIDAVRECVARNRIYFQGKPHDAVVYPLIPGDMVSRIHPAIKKSRSIDRKTEDDYLRVFPYHAMVSRT